MIELKTSDSGFSIIFKGKSVLSHSIKRPAVTIGVGSAGYKTFKNNSSSFRIKDKISWKRGLTEFEVIRKEGKALEINFENTLVLNCSLDKQGRMAMKFTCHRVEVNRFWLALEGSKGEHIYGCGEQYTHLDLKGRRVPLWVEEQGVGRGFDLMTLLANLHSGAGGTWYTTYFPMPTFVSSGNYFCHIDMSAYAAFDFRKKDRHTLEMWEVPAEIIIDAAETAPALLKSLTTLLGTQEKLPDWTWDGVWLGVQGGSEAIDKKLKAAQEAGVKVGGLWAQDWEGIRITSFGKQLMWDWKYDEELYAGLPLYIKKLKKENIKFFGYINPMIAQESDFYKEAVQKDYLVKNPDDTVTDICITSFPVGLVDLTNPQAKEWYKKIIKKHMLGIDLAGWMADFGEALPADAQVFSGESGETLHNRYPALWAETNREALVEAGKEKDIVYWMRAGYTGSSRNGSAVWAGDQTVNWSFDDGLATVIPAGISLGYCGIGNYHSDIGGYTTLVWLKRTQELFMRWAEQCVFSPIMRSHEGNRPDTNHQFYDDAETLAHLAKMTRLFTAMKPYHQQCQKEYQSQGLPFMRHVALHYEGDETAYRQKYQYLYGRDLLAAPVIKKRKTTQKVYLPDDTWIHLWNGKTYGKGWHRVDAPLGEPPVFYRDNSKFKKLFESLKKV